MPWDAIGGLSSLRALRLDDAGLAWGARGAEGARGGSWPVAALARLGALEELSLRDNRIEAPPPPELLAALPKLRVLDLRGNPLADGARGGDRWAELSACRSSDEIKQ